jgi:nicotinamide mononucleotide transporter
MLQIVEIIAVLFATAYLALVIRESLWCWPAALVSVSLFMVLYLDSRLYMQALLQIYYFAMAIYGWWQWNSGGEQHRGVRIHWWSPLSHIVAIAVIVVVSGIFGRVLAGTDAAFPYIDSFATVAALVTTFMVARKVIENWIYWFVVDAVLVYLFWKSDLHWTAGLYVLYLVMVVIGFWSWLKSSRMPEKEADGRTQA